MMESKIFSDRVDIPKKSSGYTRLKSYNSMMSQSPSASPDITQSTSHLPPLLFNLKQKNYLNFTPPPRATHVKLQPICHSYSRIPSIVKKSLFPDNIPKQIGIPRAPSVNDIQPLFMKSFRGESISCKRCNNMSIAYDTLHLSEYKIWGLCSNCQNLVFSTVNNQEYSRCLTFRDSGEFYEFSLSAEIEFWLEGKMWKSLLMYLQAFRDKNGMYRAAMQKVKQHPRLEELLRNTGEKELIYLLPNDSYWGIEFNGTGKNTLGKILMRIRNEIRKTKAF